MMNKKIITLLMFIIFTCQLAVISIAMAAENIESLVDQGKLTINLKVNQSEQQIVGQALILAVEVSTERWFATGSQIQHFTLQDTVMQANNIATINGSKRIDGKTWATQTHELTLYPTAYGDYQVPPINVDISVNTENNGIVSGVLTTQEVTFTIELPEALNGIDNFIVSPQVTLNIDGQFNQAQDYAVGEAITQTITITASDTPAMMITPINFVVNSILTNNKTTLDGVSIYHKPAQVFDKSNRGTLLGTRVESFTYIFEKAGSYTIDEQVIYWWNSETSTLERLLIPSSTWAVSGAGLSQMNSSAHLKGLNLTINTVIAFILAMLLLILLFMSFVKRDYLSAVYNKLTKFEHRKLRNDFLNAIIQKNYVAATQYLYQYVLLSSTQVQDNGYLLSAKLNELAFNNNNTEKSPVSFSVHEAKALIKKIDTSAGVHVKHANFTSNERINLNSE